MNLATCLEELELVYRYLSHLAKSSPRSLYTLSTREKLQTVAPRLRSLPRGRPSRRSCHDRAHYPMKATPTHRAILRACGTPPEITPPCRRPY